MMISRTLLRAVVTVAFAGAILLSLLTPMAPASAADDPADPTVTWSVRPADEFGPDGRAWVERELEPGETTTEHMAIVNLGASPVTFAISGADGYFTRTGRFNMLASGEESTGAGTWIEVPSTVTIDAGATAVIPFQVAVPADATPGDHAAGVAASIRSQSASEGNAVTVESRVGFRVMVRVAGEVLPELSLSATGEYVTAWNPLDPGSVIVRGTFRNSGNVRIEAAGRVVWGDKVFFANGMKADTVTELLPGDERDLEFRVSGVSPFGPLSVPMSVESSIILPDGSREELPAQTETILVWAIPWPQLLVVLAGILIIGGVVWRGRQRQREVDSLVTAAREEGRREALTKEVAE